MIETFSIFEICWILRCVPGREARSTLLSILTIRVAKCRLYLLLVLIGRERYVLWPEGGRCPVLEDKMRRNVCKSGIHI
ncbi:unnamed protein product, partial [Iphiclides podalirius]